MEFNSSVKTADEYRSFISFLISNADEEYKAFHSGLLNSKKPVIGIRTPDLRRLAKRLAAEDYRAFLEVCGDDYYEEAVLRGMVIGYAKLSFCEFLEEFYRFLPYVENWAVCDFCLSSMKIVKKNREAMFKEIERLIFDEREFYARAAAVLLLWYYADEDYAERIFPLLNRVETERYYVRMAVAWCVSELYVKCRKQTLEFLKDNSLDDFTHNKAIQKITESNRVSREEKAEIRKMKR